MGAGKKGRGGRGGVKPIHISIKKIVNMYWYRERHSGSAECIMTGQGRGMEEEEGSAVSDDRTLC